MGGVCTTSSANVCCSASVSAIASSQPVGIPHAEVWRSPISYRSTITTSAPDPASSRAIASPAKLAPQIRTSQSRSIGVRCAPRFVALVGIGRSIIRARGQGFRDSDGPPAPAILRGLMSLTTMSPPTDLPGAKIVEGSDGLLLEIDGQIVPNYDATLHPFTEGDVV